MRSRLHPAAMLDRLRSTYWFVPSIFTAAATALAVATTAIDRRFPDATSWLEWAYGGGADGARALLSAIAGSTITVVSVTFSVIVVALTVASQHFGPRLLNSFMRDSVAQAVLGTFTGTFAYCLLVLRTVQGEGDGYSSFVPHFAVTMAVVLTLFSVAMLIYYVHHVASSLRVSEITTAVARDLERTVDRLYPQPLGEGTEPPAAEPPPVPADALVVGAAGPGYVQEIDADRILETATDAGCVVWLRANPGSFVTEGQPIAEVYPPPADPGSLGKRLNAAYVLGHDRTSRQDAAFAVQQLVEVALRALSPGVNEPFTAMTCIDRLGQGLARLATRKIPSAVRKDDEGAVRVIAAPQTFPPLLEGAFEPMALQVGANRMVAHRLLATLEMLAGAARRDEDLQAIRRTADLVRTCAARALHGDERHLAELARHHESVLAALARARSRP